MLYVLVLYLVPLFSPMPARERLTRAHPLAEKMVHLGFATDTLCTSRIYTEASFNFTSLLKYPLSTMSTYAPLATPRLDRKILLDRLTRMVSKTSGLSAVFMLAQYSSPLIVSLLLRLAAIRSRRNADAAKGLVRAAEGWTKVAAGAAEARVVMRSFGTSRHLRPS
jgi:hypothetical protein